MTKIGTLFFLSLALLLSLVGCIGEKKTVSAPKIKDDVFPNWHAIKDRVVDDMRFHQHVNEEEKFRGIGISEKHFANYKFEQNGMFESEGIYVLKLTPKGQPRTIIGDVIVVSGRGQSIQQGGKLLRKLDALAQKGIYFNIITYDHKGQGNSEGVGASVKCRKVGGDVKHLCGLELGEDLEKVINKFSKSPNRFIFAHSMGAAVTLMYTSNMLKGLQKISAQLETAKKDQDQPAIAAIKRKQKEIVTNLVSIKSMIFIAPMLLPVIPKEDKTLKTEISKEERLKQLQSVVLAQLEAGKKDQRHPRYAMQDIDDVIKSYAYEGAPTSFVANGDPTYGWLWMALTIVPSMTKQLLESMAKLAKTNPQDLQYVPKITIFQREEDYTVDPEVNKDFCDKLRPLNKCDYEVVPPVSAKAKLVVADKIKNIASSNNANKEMEIKKANLEFSSLKHDPLSDTDVQEKLFGQFIQIFRNSVKTP